MQAVTTQQFLNGDCIEFLHGDSRPRLSDACRIIGDFNTDHDDLFSVSKGVPKGGIDIYILRFQRV